MKISKNFDIREFIPPIVWKLFGTWAQYFFINKDLVQIVQHLRDEIGEPITINNWHVHGNYKNSGFRMPFTKIGAKFSAHKLALAVDIKVNNKTPYEVYKIIMDNEDFFFRMGLRRIEDPRYTPSWLHIDLLERGSNENGIKVFKP